MATLQSLTNSTRSYKPILFQNARSVRVETIKVTTSFGTRTKFFSTTTRDPTAKSGVGRRCQIAFVYPSGTTKEELEACVPIFSKTRALVRSGSPFYKFAFGYNNRRIGAHQGTLSTFSRKGTRPPINPKNSPGLDKHLIGLVDQLIKRKLIAR